MQEILGVTREQFAQISMIAQGEFRRLLQADTKTRIDIFRGIFQTGRYAALQKKIRDEALGGRGEPAENCARVCSSMYPASSAMREAKLSRRCRRRSEESFRRVKFCL